MQQNSLKIRLWKWNRNAVRVFWSKIWWVNISCRKHWYIVWWVM